MPCRRCRGTWRGDAVARGAHGALGQALEASDVEFAADAAVVETCHAGYQVVQLWEPEEEETCRERALSKHSRAGSLIHSSG